MINRLIWFAIAFFMLVYFSNPWMKSINASIVSKFTIGKQVEANLALMPTSPRWKYPWIDHNATIDDFGEFIFPPSSIPIVSIKISEDDLFSYAKGIYHRGIKEWEAKNPELAWWDWPANYKQRGKDWERPASIDFIGFTNDYKNIEVGIRINGNATRAFPQKSLRLIFDESSLDDLQDLDSSLHFSKTMILRNGGNDWDRAMMRDVLVASLSKKLNVETQDAIAYNVYLNGEYWGIHYLRPKIDDDHLAEKYHIERDSISIIESPFELYRGDSLGLVELTNIIDFVTKKDMSINGNFEILESKLDIESFVDYLLIQIFIVNIDWPQNNWMIWKDLSNNYNSGKWKWILKDTDYGLGFFDKNAYSYNMLNKIERNNGAIGILFRNLLMNDKFSKLFYNRKAELLEKQLSTIIVNNSIDSIAKRLRMEMPKQIDRWRTHLSLDQWEYEVYIIKEFHRNRMVNY